MFACVLSCVVSIVVVVCLLVSVFVDSVLFSFMPCLFVRVGL